MLLIYLILLLVSLYLIDNYLNYEKFKNNSNNIYKIINNNKECILYKNNNKLLNFNKDLICNEKKYKIIKGDIPFIYKININDKKYDFYIENNNKFNLNYNNHNMYNIFLNLINNKEIITIRDLNFNKLCIIKHTYKNEFDLETQENFNSNLGFTIFNLINNLKQQNLLF